MVTSVLYHFSMQPVQRSKGQSVVGKAAYIERSRMRDAYTGKIHDYRRGSEKIFNQVIGWDDVRRITSEELWNLVEQHHKRWDAVPAREIIAALPYMLSPLAQRELAIALATLFCAHYGVLGELALHHPSRTGDARNIHFHLLYSACAVKNGELGRKVESLDPFHCYRRGLDNPANFGRTLWEELVNQALAENGVDGRVDHRSFKDMGINREPGIHLGAGATEFERRTGKKSRRRRDHELQTERRRTDDVAAAERIRHAQEEWDSRKAEENEALLSLTEAPFPQSLDIDNDDTEDESERWHI